MKFRQFPPALALLSVLVAAPGCKDFYDVNVNPLAPTKAELFSLLPVTQVAMATGLGDSPSGMSQYTMALMQQLASTRNIGTFQQAGDSFSNEWTSLYTDMLVNNQQIITQGTTEQSWTYVGIAQLQRAFVFSQMVDLWGSIPYSQALQGGVIATPRFDSDVEIYNGGSGIQGLFSLIDEGIANLAKAAPSTGLSKADLIYRGDKDKWARFGRSLKLKLYNQIRNTRNVAADVAPLIANGNNLILSGDGQDFELNYGTSITPDNRNLGFIADYATPSRENRINPNFYLSMKVGTNRYYDGNVGIPDPRVPYYFFNQASATHPLAAPQDFTLGNFVSVRFGSNGPLVGAAATNYITLPGLYPVGGRYDDGQGGTASATSSIAGTVSAKGVVAQRLHTYFSRKYTEAELQLTVLNDNNAAATALRDAIGASFDKVNSIAIKDGSPAMNSATVTAYIDAALAAFNRAGATLDDKLEVIMYEKYVASFGYGVDMYTDFRRTYHPRIKVPGNAEPAKGLIDDVDPATISTGPFPRRLYYPINDLLVNPNGPQAQVAQPIFWDK
jgi:hypothetical protein